MFISDFMFVYDVLDVCCPLVGFATTKGWAVFFFTVIKVLVFCPFSALSVVVFNQKLAVIGHTFAGILKQTGFYQFSSYTSKEMK